MKKILLLGLICLSLNSILFAGVPTLSPMITVVLKNGDQVTLYGDSDNAEVLYFFPSRLVLKKENGQTCFNAILFRGVTRLNTEQIISNSQAGKLGGGVADFMLELQGPTKNMEELRQLITQQHPKYARYRLAQVPLVPGAASVTMKHHALAGYNPMSGGNFNISPDDTSKLNASNGPVSDQLGSAIVGRFKLSELDALVLMETINKGNFTAAFDVTYTAEARINFPATNVTVEANEKRIYNYVEQHFKSKGGFFVFSFSADIRKIREKLTESGDLKVKINIQDPAITLEFLNSLADKWLENWVMKKMHQTPLDIPKLRAEATYHQRKNPFSKWADLGATYSRVDIDQYIDKKASFTWSFQGVQNFPVFAKGEFTGLRSANVIAVDYNQSFFSQIPIAVIPFRAEAMQDRAFKEATVTFSAQTNDGFIEKRTASFNYEQRQPYWNLVPLQLKIQQDPQTGLIQTYPVSNITYSLRCKTDMCEVVVENQPFEFSTSGFDCPSITLERHVGWMTVELYRPTSIFDSTPDLEKIEVVFPSINGSEIRVPLSEEQPTANYFYNATSTEVPQVTVVAKYSDGSAKSKAIDIGRRMSILSIGKSEIPR